MGFWQGFKRLLVGQPVFQPTDSVDKSVRSALPPVETGTGKTPVDDSGRKIIPEVEISNVDCNRGAEDMTVWVMFKNSSAEPVYLDKIHFLGVTRQLDFEIAGHGARQFEVYKGALMTTDAYRNAELYYRLVSSGDYFQARYFVEPNYDDGYYFPEQFHLQRPVRDI